MEFYYTCARKHLRHAFWPEGTTKTPILIAASACYLKATGRLVVPPIPALCHPVFGDSGGFFFAQQYGEYPFPIDAHYGWVEALNPQYAAIRDYPCEIEIAPNDAAVASRQARTLANCAAMLKVEIKGTAWVPVLQGRTPEQYVTHARQHQAAGLVRPYMGIGSLCRRKNILEIEAIVAALTDALPGVTFHLFGVKLELFTRHIALPASVVSADSGAWGGRFGTDIELFNQVASANKWSQAQTELFWSLPKYRQKVVYALAQPKQPIQPEMRVVPIISMIAPLTRPVDLINCQVCDYRVDMQTLDYMDEYDEEELSDILWCIQHDICPLCLAPTNYRPTRKRKALVSLTRQIADVSIAA